MKKIDFFYKKNAEKLDFFRNIVYIQSSILMKIKVV